MIVCNKRQTRLYYFQVIIFYLCFWKLSVLHTHETEYYTHTFGTLGDNIASFMSLKQSITTTCFPAVHVSIRYHLHIQQLSNYLFA